MAAETMIVNLILDALVDHLTTKMITEPELDKRLHIVKKGLLQQNKVQYNLAIGVMGGDHEDPNYKDGIVTWLDGNDIAMEVPAREIGGGQMWWRRGTIRVECFFVASEKQTEDTAHELAYEILGRLLANIETCPLVGLEDDFGEQAIKIFCYGNTFFESGGPPNQYIFRGKVFWQALTERP